MEFKIIIEESAKIIVGNEMLLISIYTADELDNGLLTGIKLQNLNTGETTIIDGCYETDDYKITFAYADDDDKVNKYNKYCDDIVATVMIK